MRLPRFLPPLLVLVLGVLIAGALVRSRERAETRPTSVAIPTVQVRRVAPTDYTFQVAAQGTVSPRTEVALTAEVGGRVIEVSPRLAAGSFFDAGDVLLRLEPVDYEAAVARAEAELRRAEVRLAQERAQAEVAVREWNRLEEDDPPPLTARELQVAEAEASVQAARAALRQARKNLERTTVRAPFAGRVLAKLVERGQFVPPGTPVARIHAIDYVEVRLPLPDTDAAFVDLPLYPGQADESGSPVRLTLRYGGAEYTWNGRVDRTEAALDVRSRVLYAVVRVPDPYRPAPDGRPPLTAGSFVDALIRGRTVSGVVVIPRSALRGRDQVLVVDDEDRLHIRRVDVLKLHGEDVVIQSGLAAGERIVVSPLEAPVDGMQVHSLDEQPQPAAETGGAS